MQETWLVTGGAGFIGGNFVLEALSTPDRRVVNLDALTYAGNLDTLDSLTGNDRHIFVEGSIGDRELVDRLLAEYNPSAVVNFAAESHVDRSIDGPAAFIDTNVVGTLSLLEGVNAWWQESKRNAFRFLHVSTDEVYGSLGPEGRFTEESPYAPNSPYSASKASSDHLVRAFHHTYGLPVLTTNCSNNYGPFQFPEKLIPLVTLKALRGEPLPVYGDGSNVRDWLYVGDHCAAIRAVLRDGRPGEVYNIGGDAERTNLEVVKSICSLVDELAPSDTIGSRESLIEFVTDRPGHDQRYAIDASKMAKELSWSPSRTFEDGLRETVEWYLSNEPWWSRVMDGSYRGERLGEATQS